MLPAALSNVYTGSSLVAAGRGLFRGFAYVETSGTDPVTLAFYDAASTSDTAKPLVPGAVFAKSTGDIVSLGAMVAAYERGLALAITGAAKVTVFYNPETRWLWDLNVFNTGDDDYTPAHLARAFAEMGT